MRNEIVTLSAGAVAFIAGGVVAFVLFAAVFTPSTEHFVIAYILIVALGATCSYIAIRYGGARPAVVTAMFTLPILYVGAWTFSSAAQVRHSVREQIEPAMWRLIVPVLLSVCATLGAGYFGARQRARQRREDGTAA